MAMLFGSANGSTMVRHVLDVHEGDLPSNHTIPTLGLFPCFKYKLHSNQWPDDCTFFPVIICNLMKEPAKNIGMNLPKQSNIATNGQMTVPFSGRNLIEEPTETI
jgi:hypothetical protein